MVQFLPVAESWRRKQRTYQRHQVTWWREIFTASFLIHDPHTEQSDGGGNREIVKLPAHHKVTHLGSISATAPLCPFFPAPLAPLWPIKHWPSHSASPHTPAFSASQWWDTGSFSAKMRMLRLPEQLMQGSSALFIHGSGMWEMPCLSPKYISLKPWWWCSKVL